MIINSIDKINAGGEVIPPGIGPVTGAQVVFADATIGTKVFQMTQLPGNLTTAGQVEAFLNTIVDPVNDPNRSRFIAFLLADIAGLTLGPKEGLYGFIHVLLFDRVSMACDFDVFISTDMSMRQTPWLPLVYDRNGQIVPPPPPPVE